MFAQLTVPLSNVKRLYRAHEAAAVHGFTGLQVSYSHLSSKEKPGLWVDEEDINVRT